MLKIADIMTTKKGLHTLIVKRRHEQDAYGIVTETDIVYKVAAFGGSPGRTICDFRLDID